MLQLFKNDTLTSASLQQGNLRQKELDFYTNNYWTLGATATVMAGFVFSQFTNPIPEGTPFWLESLYITFTSVCLGLNLCIITWTVLICMWGPGMALRGPDGMKSFHQVIDFLKSELPQIYNVFQLCIVCYFGSTCSMVWVYPSDPEVNWCCMGMLAVCFVAIAYLHCKLELRIGGSWLNHEGADGRIRGFRILEEVADLDTYVFKNAPSSSVRTATHMPGMHDFDISER